MVLCPESLLLHPAFLANKIMNRSIVHIDLDAFFVSVECLKQPQLLGKPVIVGGSSDRGVVAACSYEARKFGVHSAMPARMARQLCPQAIFLRGDYEAYSQYSRAITELIDDRAPLVEKASIDEFYIDMTGMERFIGCYKWADQLKKDIKTNIGLNTTFALSTSKTVSKIAVGEAKPDGQIQIASGTEKAFLKPLHIQKMPMIGDKTALHLTRMGVQTVGTLAQIPLKVLMQVFGKNGKWMWERANGIDLSPVVPHTSQKSLSKESTFSADTIEVDFLRQELIAMVSHLAFELRKLGQVTGCITLKIRYADFDTHTQQMTIAFTAADHVLRQHALNLFNKLYSRRILVRLIGIRFTKLVAGGMQLNIFDKSNIVSPLYQAMDKIRTKHGMKSLMEASTLGNRIREKLIK